MESKLHILIAYCKEEKNRLHKLIDDCVKEEEYQLAYFHQQALYQLIKQLQTLHNLGDIFYDEKHREQRWINELKKRIEETNSNEWKEHLNKQVQSHKEVLDKLNKTATQSTLSGKEKILDNCLSDLVQKKIKSIKLILIKSDNFLLHFHYHNKLLKVVVPHIKTLVDKQVLQEQHIKGFINFGFNWSGKQSKLILQLGGNKEIIAERLKLTLSKIVFEIFYFKQFQNESYIEIIPKTH